MAFKVALRLRMRPSSYQSKITQDVRDYAAQKEIDEQAALGVGHERKG
jgi:hypothetical protein